jgi:hypothetical protein
MEIWRGQQEGLDVIIVNPGIMWSWIPRTGKRPTFKEVANGLRYYTLGKGAFVAVSDVVRMSVELMKSSTQPTLCPSCTNYTISRCTEYDC